MPNKQPERSVDELVEKFAEEIKHEITNHGGDIVTIAHNLCNQLTQTLTAERQRCEEMVEKLEEIMKIEIGDSSPTRLALQNYLNNFTQPNNPQ